MNIPPVLANLPLLKLFKGAEPGRQADAGTASVQQSKNPQDVVQLSAAARQKQDIDEARATAVQTKDLLAESPYDLGLDPDFA